MWDEIQFAVKNDSTLVVLVVWAEPLCGERWDWKVQWLTGRWINVMPSISFRQTLITLKVFGCESINKRRGSLTYRDMILKIELMTSRRGFQLLRIFTFYQPSFSILSLFLPMTESFSIYFCSTFFLALLCFWHFKFWQNCTFNMLFFELFTSERPNYGFTSG